MSRAIPSLPSGMLNRHPSESLRKILYLQIENLGVRTAQEQCLAWHSDPYIIAEKGEKGTIYALSPAAKQAGITTKMTRTEAMGCDPQVEYIQPIDTPCTSLQERIFKLLCEYTDLVEKSSDRAFYLDITFNKQDIPIGYRTAQLLNNQLQRELELDVVIGMGPNKLLAQLAGRTCTNRSIASVDRQTASTFLAELPIGLIPRLGRTTRTKLQTLGIENIGQLADMDLPHLQKHVGRAASRLYQYARGIDDEPVSPEVEADSLTTNIRFPTPLYDREEIRTSLQQPVDTLAARMRRRALRSRLIVIGVSSGQSFSQNIECPLSYYTDSSQALLAALIESLHPVIAKGHEVRELHIEVREFTDKNAQQLDLFHVKV